MNDPDIVSLRDRVSRPCRRSTHVVPDAVKQQLYLADSVWYPLLNYNSAASGDVLFWTLLEVLPAEFTAAILNCVMGGRQPQPRLHCRAGRVFAGALGRAHGQRRGQYAVFS
ncbi:unnamed protein product [Ixodes persulcatus]